MWQGEGAGGGEGGAGGGEQIGLRLHPAHLGGFEENKQETDIAWDRDSLALC
jgi:hypothetical protein